MQLTRAARRERAAAPCPSWSGFRADNRCARSRSLQPRCTRAPLRSTTPPGAGGDNTLGTLGSTVARSDVPVAVASTVSFMTIAAGRYQTCGLAVDGRAYCWGTNLFGELGSDASPDVCDGLPCARAPTPVAGALTFSAISVRGRTVCALTTDSLPHCWGLGDHGQLGSPAPTVCSGRPCARAPTPVSPSFKAVSISVGQSHVCALAASGAAYRWGQNDDGRLGTGTSGDTPRPTRVADPR